jgi:aspartate racemase
MPKTLGIIGGIAPESTIEYYRQIVSGYRVQRADGNYPQIIINSIDMKRMLGLIADGRLEDTVRYLVGEVEKLARAGADFGLFASNTPHIVFEEIQSVAPIPLISIVTETRRYAGRQGFRSLGLFGTRFTMQGSFYPRAFEKEGMVVVTPDPDGQNFIHDRYMAELVHGVFKEGTRDRLLAIIATLKRERQIEAVILGGTELPLILREGDAGDMPLIDTTHIHALSAVAALLEGT